MDPFIYFLVILIILTIIATSVEYFTTKRNTFFLVCLGVSTLLVFALFYATQIK